MRLREFDLNTENERYLFEECMKDKARIAELEAKLKRIADLCDLGCSAEYAGHLARAALREGE